MRLTALLTGIMLGTAICSAQRTIDLKEVVVTDTPRRNVMHMLGFVREYSTLTSFTDTVFLMREKLVDFMVPRTAQTKYRGWTTPRILTTSMPCRTDLMTCSRW